MCLLTERLRVGAGPSKRRARSWANMALRWRAFPRRARSRAHAHSRSVSKQPVNCQFSYSWRLLSTSRSKAAPRTRTRTTALTPSSMPPCACEPRAFSSCARPAPQPPPIQERSPLRRRGLMSRRAARRMRPQPSRSLLQVTMREVKGSPRWHLQPTSR